MESAVCGEEDDGAEVGVAYVRMDWEDNIEMCCLAMDLVEEML